MSRCQRHDDYSAAPALHLGRADDRAFRIISAFHDHIGTQKLNEAEGCVFRKNYNQIDAFQARQHVAAFRISADRPRWPLQASHGFVAVDSDNQGVGGLSRGRKNVDVTGMKKVKHAVGEGDLSLLCRAPALCIDPRRDFAGRIAWLQSLLAAMGWK